MQQIRKNVFETNSSSTHTLAICTEDEYKDWQNGKLLFNKWHETFVKNSIKITKQDREEAERCYTQYNCFFNPVYNTEYTVTISDEISYNEFTKKYEVLKYNEENNTYVIREKENVD